MFADTLMLGEGIISEEPSDFRSELSLFSGSLACSRSNDRRLDIHLVGTSGQRSLACELLNRMYGWRGYGVNHTLSSNNNSATFAATFGGEIVATLTLTVDSRSGLAAEKTFGDVIKEARAVHGSRLCELTSFASQPSDDSRQFLAALFHTIFIYGTVRYGCTDLFIEVNPRHVRFYENMLGFHKVSDLRDNQAVNAPAQLMCLKVADIGRHIERYTKHEDRPYARSLYPFFFSLEEEAIVRSCVQDRFVPLERPKGSSRFSNGNIRKLERFTEVIAA